MFSKANEGETEFIPNDGNEIRPSMGMKHK